jgi:hypothetical protein
MSLLWIALGIIFRVNIRIDDAGSRTRMIGSGSPRSIQQFDVPELIERDAAPVIR